MDTCNRYREVVYTQTTIPRESFCQLVLVQATDVAKSLDVVDVRADDLYRTIN